MGDPLVISTNGAEQANFTSDPWTPTSLDGQPPIAEPPDIRQSEKATCFHTRSAQRVADQLGSDPDHGLSGGEAAARLVRDGPNVIKGSKGISLWKIFLQQVANALTLVLVAVAILSYVIGDYVEGSVVVAVIVLNIIVGYESLFSFWTFMSKRFLVPVTHLTDSI